MTNVCGKLIIASVALAGLFSSCVEEGTNTSFEVGEAVANITITVVEKGTGNDITSASTLSYTKGAYTIEQGAAANKFILKGNKAIEATAVAFQASWKDKYNDTYTGSCIVSIPSILAGGKGDFVGTIIIEGKTEPASDFDYSFEQTIGETTTAVGYLEKTAHDYMDKKWVANDSQYLLEGTADYTNVTGTYALLTFYVPTADADDKAYVDSFKAGIPELPEQTPAKFDFKVSAYAYYNVFVTYVTTSAMYTCFKTNKYTKVKTEIGYVLLGTTGTTVQYEEVAMPQHAGHYIYGHGHDTHGQGGNAGGGIIVAE